MHPRQQWLLVGAASLILLVLMGSRQSQGLFVSPINSTTGIGIVPISLAIALGHLFWGLIQPAAGWIADKYGAGRVLVFGILTYALGMALTATVRDAPALIFTLGFMAATGAGAASFSVLLGAVGRRISVEKRGLAAGVINAGSSLGQFIFAPITQSSIDFFGWHIALIGVGVVACCVLPLVYVLRDNPSSLGVATTREHSPSLKFLLIDVFSNKSYIYLHLGFMTCGFHIAFLSTHLPGEVALCGQSANVASWSLGIVGLANVLGSLTFGWLTQKFRSKYLLFAMYFSRAVLILLYLIAPKTEITFYLFSVGLGFTWLATVAPTATIVSKLFGTRFLATLFGLTLVSHQLGGFLGAYSGGVAMSIQGTYQWIWIIDASLALLAALICLPIQEPQIDRKTSSKPR